MKLIIDDASRVPVINHSLGEGTLSYIKSAFFTIISYYKKNDLFLSTTTSNSIIPLNVDCQSFHVSNAF